MFCWIPVANFLVQLAILVALVWYAVETWRIRKASEEQAEAQQKPCLTVVTAPRDYDEAILEMNGAVGGMVVAPRNGNIALENMGNGPAINVSYNFNPVDPSTVSCPHGYLQNIRAGGTFIMAVARGVLSNREYELIVTYESLSGRRYESRITINNLVLTAFHFRRTVSIPVAKHRPTN